MKNTLKNNHNHILEEAIIFTCKLWMLYITQYFE